MIFCVVVQSKLYVMWGTSPAVKKYPDIDLENATTVVNTWWCSFAAITGDDVLTWGTPETGGDSTTVRKLLSESRTISLLGGIASFTALQENGRVVSWGSDIDLSTVHALANHKAVQIISNNDNFAALLNDTTVVCWGLPGATFLNMSTVQSALHDITQLYWAYFSFAALTADGGLVVWGSEQSIARNTTTVSSLLRDISTVYGNSDSYAALLNDSSIVTWGDVTEGGDSLSVQHLLKDIVDVVSSERAFAAKNSSGNWVTWGNPSFGGDASKEVLTKLKDSTLLVGSRTTFAAVTTDGTVVAWGSGPSQDTTTVKSLLKNIVSLYATYESYVAVTSSGKVVSWGSIESDISTVGHVLNDPRNRVDNVIHCDHAFTATLQPVPYTPTETLTLTLSDTNVADSGSGFPLVTVICVVAAVVVCVVCIIILLYRRRRRSVVKQLVDSDFKNSLITIIGSSKLETSSRGLWTGPHPTAVDHQKSSGLHVEPIAIKNSGSISLSSLECEIPSDQLTDFVQIGTGFFGKVFRATYVTCCEVVAVKESRKAYDSNFLVEIRMLCNMRQKDIVTFYGWSRSDESIYLVTQYYEQGSLDNFLRFKRVDPEQYALRMVSIARALAYVHGLGLAHMDVATRNILVSKNGLVLGDMGLVTKIGSVVKSKLPIAWCPPEALQSSPIASAAHDVWSFGCTMFEIMGGRSPYSDMVSGDPVVRRKQITKFIKSGILPKKPDNLQKLGEKLWNDIVERCWTGIDKRLSIQDIFILLEEMPVEEKLRILPFREEEAINQSQEEIVNYSYEVAM